MNYSNSWQGLTKAEFQYRAAQAQELQRAIHVMTAALAAGEWAEHVSTDLDVMALECEITKLIGKVQAKLAAAPPSGLHESAQAVIRKNADAITAIKRDLAASPPSEQEGSAACPTSRGNLLEIKPNDRATENSDRRAGEEKHRGDEAGGCDAVRTGGAESGARGDNAAQHEVAQRCGAGNGAASPPPGSVDTAAAPATRDEQTCPECNGSGDREFFDTTRGPDGEKYTANCDRCGGTGALTEEAALSSPVNKTPASGAASPARTAEGTGASNGADAQRLDWLEKHCTGASDSERYLPFRIYWGKPTMGGFKGIRAAIDAALAGEGRK